MTNAQLMQMQMQSNAIRMADGTQVTSPGQRTRLPAGSPLIPGGMPD